MCLMRAFIMMHPRAGGFGEDFPARGIAARIHGTF
jgi:hypothetical protein